MERFPPLRSDKMVGLGLRPSKFLRGDQKEKNGNAWLRTLVPFPTAPITSTAIPP